MTRRSRNHLVDRHVGATIRMRRKALGVSQTTLAARVGLTFQQVQKYEHGTNRVSASTLYEIARALSTPVAEFFEGLQATGPQSSRQSRALVKFVATKEGSAVAEAFPGIGSKTRRRAIANLIGALSKR
jgi:transcriptional regulator with XRE-family HTH domain